MFPGGQSGRVRVALSPGQRFQQIVELPVERRGQGNVFVERQHGRASDLTTRHAKENHGFPGGARQDHHRVEIAQVSHQLGPPAKQFMHFLDPAVDLLRHLEGE